MIQSVTSKLYSEERQILHLFVTSFGLRRSNKDSEEAQTKDRIIEQLYSLAKASTPYIRYLALACISYLRPVVEDEGNQRTAQQCLFIALPLIRFQASSGNPIAMVFMGFHYAYTECVDDEDRDKVFTLLFDMIEKDDVIARDELTRIAKKAILNEAAKQALQVFEQNAPTGTMTALSMASMAYNHFGGGNNKEKAIIKEEINCDVQAVPVDPIPISSEPTTVSAPTKSLGSSSPPLKPPRSTPASSKPVVALDNIDAGPTAPITVPVSAANEIPNEPQPSLLPTVENKLISSTVVTQTSQSEPPKPTQKQSNPGNQEVTNPTAQNQCCVIV